MMDIVDRLRSLARTVDIIPDHNAIHEAADEITALREKLKKLESDNAILSKWHLDAERALAEDTDKIIALREKLKDQRRHSAQWFDEARKLRESLRMSNLQTVAADWVATYNRESLEKADADRDECCFERRRARCREEGRREMNIDDMTYGELKQIAAMFGAGKPSTSSSSTRVEGDGRPVIVRARDAGVHYGKLVAYDGRTVWLRDSRRMWKWKALNGVSLSGCATAGINATESRIEPVVSHIAILDACEIIDCTANAAKTIEDA